MIVSIKFYEEPEGCFVEGIYGKLDHFAQGKTMDEAVDNYIESLQATMDAHMDLYGNIDRIVDPEDQIDEED